MGTLDRIKEQLRGQGARVVFPEADEPRVAEAMEQLAAEGLCIPIPVSEPSDAQVAALVSARGLKPALAARMLKKPLIAGAAMVAAGEADLMVAGIASPTRKVIEAAGLAIGLAEGVSVASSFFLMAFPSGAEMIWADCAVNVDPSATDLASIARASAASCEALTGPAKVALLSYSTGASGIGDSVEKVRAAAQETGFDGPLQADAALNAAIAQAKGEAGGDANVLVFPSLDAGNIAYKLAQELAGAQAIGPILQGFAKPVCDLSRGAKVDDIIAATLVTMALANLTPPAQ